MLLTTNLEMLWVLNTKEMANVSYKAEAYIIKDWKKIYIDLSDMSEVYYENRIKVRFILPYLELITENQSKYLEDIYSAVKNSLVPETALLSFSNGAVRNESKKILTDNVWPETNTDDKKEHAVFRAVGFLTKI